MELHHNPFQFFNASKTPAGLYAREKWLGESGTSQWQNDFHETVLSLMNGQSDDGSWHQSPLETIRRLFGLHLTLRKLTREIEKALSWLMERTLNNRLILGEPIERISPDAFRELPFTPGLTHLSLVCATLFLATIFQRGDEPAVMAHYTILSRWVAEKAGDMDSWADKSNVLRSFVVHPRYLNDPSTNTLVDHLGQIQDSSGCWPDPIPFFQTVNALAHLPIESAHNQWAKALMTLIDTQNADGSWGHADFEWNTFLVVHSLKNKACL
jgi:hypothetical protein